MTFYKIACSSCGSNVFNRINDIFVCANCGKPASDEQEKNIKQVKYKKLLGLGKRKYQFIIVLVILQMIFLWHIDLSLGAVWRGDAFTNGFWHFNNMQIYHLSLYGTIILTVVFGLIILKMGVKKEVMENEQN